MNIVNEIVEDDRTINDLKKDYPEEIENLEEALLDYLGQNDLKVLKTGFPNKWKYLTKNLVFHLNILIVSMIIKNLLTI